MSGQGGKGREIGLQVFPVLTAPATMHCGYLRNSHSLIGWRADVVKNDLMSVCGCVCVRRQVSGCQICDVT